MSIPLLALDPRKLVLLRSEAHAELKNELMMSLLMRLGWFVQYRESLRKYREEGAPVPTYPSARVDRVERLVDDLIVNVVDPTYKR